MTIKYGSPSLYGKLLERDGKPPLSKEQVNVYLRQGAVKGAQHMPKTVDGSKKGNWICPIDPLAPDPRRKRETE